MTKEVKLARLKPSTAHSCLRWSPDGDLAIVCGGQVIILVPTIQANEKFSSLISANSTSASSATGSASRSPLKLYSVNSTVPIETVASHIVELPRAEDESYSISMTYEDRDVIFTDICWSSTSPHGCLLATLTNRNEVIFFESVGDPSKQKWQLKVQLTDTIVSSLGSDIDVNNMTERMWKRIRVHSMAWSANFCVQSSGRWGTSFLALGTEAGEILIYRQSANPAKDLPQRQQQSIEYVGCLNLAEGRCVVNLEWSPPVISSIGSHGRIMLAAVTEDNAVYVGSFALQDDKLEVTHPDGNSSAIFREICAPSRFFPSALAWLQNPLVVSGNGHEQRRQVLALQTPVELQAYLLDDLANKVQEFCQPGSFSEMACGIVLYASKGNSAEDDGYAVDICAVSTRGTYTAITLKVSLSADITNGEGLSVSMSSSFHSASSAPGSFANSLHSLLYKRVMSHTVATGDSTGIECFGVTTHPHGTYAAVAYSLCPVNQLRYPVPSEELSRVAFIPMKTNIPAIPRPRPVSEGSSLSTWNEIQTLVRYVPKSVRIGYVQTIAHSLGHVDMEAIFNSAKSVDTSDSFCNALFNPGMDKLRLLTYLYSTNPDIQSDLVTCIDGQSPVEIIRKALAYTALSYARRNKEFESTTDFSSYDTATLLSHSQFVDPDDALVFKLDDGKSVVSISGGFFEESFDFKSASDFEEITSQSGHKWKRCCVTLLPLTTPNVLTCTGCQRKIVSRSELQGAVVGPVVETILSIIDVCLFCGARYRAK